HCSFTDINKMLVNEGRRNEVLGRVKDPEKLAFWNEFHRVSPKAYEPILNRMSKYMLIEPVRTVLKEPDAKLKISEVVDEGKILIVKLAGAGNEAANLVGTILVAKV